MEVHYTHIDSALKRLFAPNDESDIADAIAMTHGAFRIGGGILLFG